MRLMCGVLRGGGGVGGVIGLAPAISWPTPEQGRRSRATNSSSIEGVEFFHGDTAISRKTRHEELTTGTRTLKEALGDACSTGDAIDKLDAL